MLHFLNNWWKFIQIHQYYTVEPRYNEVGYNKILL